MPDAPQSGIASPRNSLTVPLTVATGVFMEGLDSTVIATSLPQMAHSLSVSPVYLSLAITSYVLSLAIFTPVSGWMADRFGARRVFCLAIVIFAASSGLCALAHSLPYLVAMRILQGLGGAMLTPVARLILVQIFPKNLLMTVTNYMVMPALLGPMAGPVVGGFITQYFSWHWIFLINIPIGILGFFLTLRFIDELPARRPPPFDMTGFLIVGAGFAMAQFWLECLGRNIIAVPEQALLFAGAALALLAYGRYARRQPNPVLDLKLFAIPSFSISIIWGSVSRLGIGGTPFLLPLLLQVGFGLDPLHAGILMFVSTSGAFLMRVGFTDVLKWLGLRRALILNAIILSFLLAGFILFHATTSHWILVPYLFVFGFMRSIQFLSLNMSSYADLTPENVSRGNTIFTVSQRISIGAGVAVAAVALSAFAGHSPVVEHHFRFTFAVLAVIEVWSIWGFRHLHPAAGREITG